MIALTIITVVKNNLEGLKATYASLKDQANQDFAWLVMDGLSTDGSQEWLAQIDRPLFKYVSRKDRSLFEAMNAAIGHLETEYCLYLNGGDYFWDRDVAGKILAAIRAKPFRIAYGNYVLGDLPGFPQRERGRHIVSLYDLFYGPVPCHQSMIISREAFRENGPYREDIAIYGDAEWILRYAKKHHPSTFTYLPFVIPYYDPVGVSYTRMFKYRSVYFRILREIGSPLEILAGILGWYKSAVFVLISRYFPVRKPAA